MTGRSSNGIVKLKPTAVFDAQHGGFTTGWSPVSWGSIDEFFVNLTIPSERLRRSLATTNAVESLLSRTRHVKRNVKRWRGGTMVLSWVAAGVLEAAKGFRRVKGCKDMPVLVAALRARDAQLGLDESSGMVA